MIEARRHPSAEGFVPNRAAGDVFAEGFEVIKGRAPRYREDASRPRRASSSDTRGRAEEGTKKIEVSPSSRHPDPSFYLCDCATGDALTFEGRS